MNIRFITDEKLSSDEVLISVNKITPELLKWASLIENEELNKIALISDDEFIIEDYERCIHFYIFNKKTMCITENGTYITKLTLKELENKSPLFIRVSNSDIININYVRKLDLSFQGTICCELKNGTNVYVARRKLRDFKEMLGL